VEAAGSSEILLSIHKLASVELMAVKECFSLEGFGFS
jgi:hypothetical protein